MLAAEQVQLLVDSAGEKFNMFMSEGWIPVFFRLPYKQGLLEKAMAPHSSTLAWKVPWAEEPGGLQSMGSLRVRHS